MLHFRIVYVYSFFDCVCTELAVSPKLLLFFLLVNKLFLVVFFELFVFHGVVQ